MAPPTFADIVAGFDVASRHFEAVTIAVVLIWAIINLLRRSKGPVQITALYIYPIKSCAGQRLQEAFYDDVGLVNDRRYMVVDEEGNFLTQREQPKMRLIVPSLEDPALDGATLTLSAPGMEEFRLDPKCEVDGNLISVTIWEQGVDALDCGNSVAAWLTKYLKRPARLVRTQRGGKHKRPILDYTIRSGRHKRLGDQPVHSAFQDGFHFLLTAEESLAELNRRIARRDGGDGNSTSISMENFRPNIVVRSRAKAFAEDSWYCLSHDGDRRLWAVKPCSRCVIPTVTVEGKFHKRFEPSRTLQTFRKAKDEQWYFGQNVVAEEPRGLLRVGETIHVLSKKPRVLGQNPWGKDGMKNGKDEGREGGETGTPTNKKKGTKED